MVGLLVIALLAGAIGCYSTPVKPPGGMIFSDIKAPLDPDMDKTMLGSKVGRAQLTSILGLVAMGDCSTTAAANAGGIKTVHYTDYEFSHILGIFQKFTVVVHGE
jgi:hypothetical protein